MGLLKKIQAWGEKQTAKAEALNKKIHDSANTRAEVVNANYGEDVQFFDIEFESDYVEGLRFRVKDFMLNDSIENYMDSQDVEADVTDCWYQ